MVNEVNVNRWNTGCHYRGAGHNGVVCIKEQPGHTPTAWLTRVATLIINLSTMPEIKITIYTTEDCNKCKLLKMMLASKHIDFRELNALDNRESIKDTWFASAPIIKFEQEWEPVMWREDMQAFISYLEDNGIGI